MRRLTTVALAILWLTGPAFSSSGLVGAQAQTEKSRLQAALHDLTDSISPFTRDPQPLQQFALSAIQSLSWLQGAAERWEPRSVEDGRPMRMAIERMAGAMRGAPTDAVRRELLPPMSQDLDDKVAFCRVQGLSGRRQVRVVTKRGAVAEVGGLEVLYLEKFFENDAHAMPRQFRGFSSPAVDDLVPGRYVFWARQPGSAPKDGPRKESRVTLSTPTGSIEVLAP
jgi:hypothetical protein